MDHKSIEEFKKLVATNKLDVESAFASILIQEIQNEFWKEVIEDLKKAGHYD